VEELGKGEDESTMICLTREEQPSRPAKARARLDAPVPR